LIITLSALFGKIISLWQPSQLPIASIDPKIEYNASADVRKSTLRTNALYALFFKGNPSKSSLFQRLSTTTTTI
jgi:hypothetical protein